MDGKSYKSVYQSKLNQLTTDRNQKWLAAADLCWRVESITPGMMAGKSELNVVVTA